MAVNNADDIVDVLPDQHRQLRQLCAQVHAASGDDKKRLFGDLAVLMRTHERGEQAVVHPVTRDHTQRGGDVIAGACTAEEERARWAICDLQHLSVDHPSFTAKFAAFYQAFLDHAAHEERDEFPRLRRCVPTQRLHTMANELRNIQTMS
jgi:Hemerythrin HHE cation binding domain